MKAIQTIFHNTKLTLLFGAIVFIGAIIFLQFHMLDIQHWVESDHARLVKIATGGLLIIGLVYQWRLLIHRIQVSNNIAFELSLHRWIGIFVIMLIVIHAGSYGFSSQKLLSASLLGIILSGLLHSTIHNAKRPVLQRIWRWIHIGFSGAVVPLILLHIWAGLAFKGGN